MEERQDIRRTILEILKRERQATIAMLSERLGVTYEAVRQQIADLERDGYVMRALQVREKGRAGRPTSSYSLTPAGDHQFPKHYDALANVLIHTVSNELGADSMLKVLTSVTDSNVARWEPILAGMTTEQKVEALKDYYEKEDSYMESDTSDGILRLVEKNCPFLNVAMKHPALCSTSVSTLSRLLGCRVEREERFQNGDRRCVFRVYTNEAIGEDFRFALEAA